MSNEEFPIIEEHGFRYYQSGKGPVIILLHGLFGALSNFYALIRYFEKNYTVCLPILPLYSLPTNDTSLTGMVNYVKDFIEYKGFNAFNLLGNSLGGHIALMYAIEHQSKVNSIVLTGSSGLFEKALGNSYPRKSDYEFVKQKTQETFYNPEVASQSLVDEVYTIVNDKEKALRILYLAKSAMRHNLRGSLTVLTIPVLLIWGQNDKITPPETGAEFHELLPNSEIQFLEDCGHAPMMERPDLFNKATENFFKRIYNQ